MLAAVSLAATTLVAARPALAVPNLSGRDFVLREETAAAGRYRTLRFTAQDAAGNVAGTAVTQWSTGDPFNPPFDFQQHTVERPVSGQIERHLLYRRTGGFLALQARVQGGWPL